MSYRINHYNGTLINVVNDGTIDKTLDITLVGKNYAGYGAVQNENFTYLLENFASVTQPPKPIPGQLWYDSGNNKIKVYDGSKFKTGGTTEISATQPTGLTIGDFWWDTINNQLHAYTGSGYALIGPQVATGSGTTEMVASTVIGKDTLSHPIIQAITNGDTVFVINNDLPFILDDDINPITGFSKIHPGITMAYSSSTSADRDGVTDPDSEIAEAHRFWGTASSADSLVVAGHRVDAASFVQSGDATFNTTVNFSHNGFTIGKATAVGDASEILRIHNLNNTYARIDNIYNDSINFTTTTNARTTYPLTLWRSNLLPGGTASPTTVGNTETTQTVYYSDNVNNIGASWARFNSVYASNFVGVATNSINVQVGTSYVPASLTATASTIAARDANGDIYANTFYGNSTNSTLAVTATKADSVKVGGDYRLAAVATSPNTLPVRDGNGAIFASTLYGNATNASLAENATNAVTAQKADTVKDGSVYRSASSDVVPNSVVIRTANSDIKASTFIGTATNATLAATATNANKIGVPLVGGGYVYRNASVSATGDTAVVRDGSADVYANIFHGQATSAQYADLAEKYLADADYEVGTVVTVGGEKEVTACKWGDRAIGAVSANPAFKMNEGLDGGTYIALKGRVPVKVVGAIKKGQRMIAANDGTAMAAVPHANDVFAIALESSDDSGVKIIECLIL